VLFLFTVVVVEETLCPSTPTIMPQQFYKTIQPLLLKNRGYVSD
jgi:hypothetical protein